MFEWTWKLLSLLPDLYLPDTWIDYMALTVMLLCAFFISRRCLIGKVRTKSSKLDFIFIFITGSPFATGYLLLNDITTSFLFIDDNLAMIHILSGEVFILSAVFLVLTVRIDPSFCTGCAACTLNCPTAALGAEDIENERRTLYSNYQCMCCATCVAVCPEEAVELRHDISVNKILQVNKRHILQRATLRTCVRCGSFYMPDIQFMKIKKISDQSYIRMCQPCKQLIEAEKHYNLDLKPITKKDAEHKLCNPYIET
jgi:Pyruvate/2-oxoacid:ferredoxin oxidoreductase delta subunit